MRVLVVPSNRECQLREFLQAWHGKGGWDRVVIVEDAARSFQFPRVEHFGWEDIDACSASAIFSRKDSGIRSFGFWKAWEMGAEYVLTLDDDVRPMDGTTDLFQQHIDAMRHPKWVSTLERYRVRGLPYRNVGEIEAKVNVGLWTGNLDLDSVHTLSGRQPPQPTAFSSLVPSGQYLPMCGMNLCFHRDAVPLMYFPLMGEGQEYRRFDDIWAGVMAKRIMDHLGEPMSYGIPFVHHICASDPFVNLVKEAPGIVRNETLWEEVDAVELSGCSVIGCMEEMGEQLAASRDAYLASVGKALGIWTGLFS